jgi:predicted translin family RNA/ssDNA-binding protein
MSDMKEFRQAHIDALKAENESLKKQLAKYENGQFKETAQFYVRALFYMVCTGNQISRDFELEIAEWLKSNGNKITWHKMREE